MENELFLLEFQQVVKKKAKTKNWLTAKRWLQDGIKVEACVFKEAGDFNVQIWSINPISDIDTKNKIISSNSKKYAIRGRFFYTITSETKNYVKNDFLISFFQSENPKVHTKSWKKANRWLQKNIDVDVCLWEENQHERIKCSICIFPVIWIDMKEKMIFRYLDGESFPLQITGNCYCYHS